MYKQWSLLIISVLFFLTFYSSTYITLTRDNSQSQYLKSKEVELQSLQHQKEYLVNQLKYKKSFDYFIVRNLKNGLGINGSTVVEFENDSSIITYQEGQDNITPIKIEKKPKTTMELWVELFL